MNSKSVEILTQEIVSIIRNHHFEVIDSIRDGKGNRLFITSANGKERVCIIRLLNLDEGHSIKILKSEFDSDINQNQWIILGLIMDRMNPVFYMIPLTVFKTPNNWFIDNDQPPRLNHMSNWEIRIFNQSVPKLEPYLIDTTLSAL